MREFFTRLAGVLAPDPVPLEPAGSGLADAVVAVAAALAARGRGAMPTTRRRFDRDFREGAVRLTRETGKPVAQVTRDPGINEKTRSKQAAKRLSVGVVTNGTGGRGGPVWWARLAH